MSGIIAEVPALFLALGFDHAHGLPVYEQHVIGRAYIGLVLPDRHTRTRIQDDGLLILKDPSAIHKV